MLRQLHTSAALLLLDFALAGAAAAAADGATTLRGAMPA